MSEGAAAPSLQAVELLLAVMEAPVPCLSGEAALDHYPEASRALVGAGLLTPHGYEEVATSIADHDDVPVSLLHSDEGGLGHFSPAVGWVAADGARVARYRADWKALLGKIARQLGIARRGGPLVLVDDHVWELGDARIGRRTHRVPIWFARRLHDQGVWLRLRKAIKARPAGRKRLVLTSTAGQRLPDDPLFNHVLVSIQDVGAESGLTIDAGILAARLDRPAMPSTDAEEPLQVIGDGREVRLHGEVFRFPKGMQRRRIVALLHERYLQGQRWVPSSEIIAQLDLPATARIRDYFKDQDKAKNCWNKLLTERGSMCGFCLD